jgi:hypothetical protein
MTCGRLCRVVRAFAACVPMLLCGMPATSVDGTAIPWVQHLGWDNHIVWGDNVASSEPALGLNVTWASHIVWGDTMFTERTAAWGRLATSPARPTSTLVGGGLEP